MHKNINAPGNKAPFQGGSKTGGELKCGAVGVVQKMANKSQGTPKDKGVNK
jgi:hypothetical protein